MRPKHLIRDATKDSKFHRCFMPSRAAKSSTSPACSAERTGAHGVVNSWGLRQLIAKKLMCNSTCCFSAPPSNSRWGQTLAQTNTEYSERASFHQEGVPLSTVTMTTGVRSPTSTGSKGGQKRREVAWNKSKTGKKKKNHPTQTCLWSEKWFRDSGYEFFH